MEESNKALLENAVDFLEKSLDEFKESPKYSILHFAIAIEILLKARLAIEHWSLVVQKNANKTNYLKGDFQSVDLPEAVNRLKNIVGEQIPNSAFRSFTKLASHRNKVIHFYHGDIAANNNTELENIIKEQCECWYHIKNLFTLKWRTHFEQQLDLFESLDFKMKRHWEYLSIIFDKAKPELEKLQKEGKTIKNCSYCNFDAVPFDAEFPELSNGKCLVCNWFNAILELKCDCGNSIDFVNEGFATCTSCGKSYEPQDVFSLVDNLGYDSSEWDEEIIPANCGYCDGYHTVAAFHDKYICTSCLETFETLGQCEYCGETNSGDMADSYWKGCGICDGAHS